MASVSIGNVKHMKEMSRVKVAANNAGEVSRVAEAVSKFSAIKRPTKWLKIDTVDLIGSCSDVSFQIGDKKTPKKHSRKRHGPPRRTQSAQSAEASRVQLVVGNPAGVAAREAPVGGLTAPAPEQNGDRVPSSLYEGGVSPSVF
eukprot:Opistho-2@88863